MYEILLQPLLLGLSSGMFCLTYCLPFIAPYMVFEERKTKEDLFLVLKFIFGRLVGYLTFGAFFGYLGERINNTTVDLMMTISLTALALILISSALGLLSPVFKFCLMPKIKKTTPYVMGFLMGVNICPPFLMSLGYIFTLHNFLKGIIFFLFFFLGTSIYFLPLTFLGLLNEMKEFRAVARISGVVVGIMFFLYGVYQLLRF